MAKKRVASSGTAAEAKKQKVVTIENEEPEIVIKEKPVKKRGLVEDQTTVVDTPKKKKIEKPKKEEVKEEQEASYVPSPEIVDKIKSQARVAVSSLIKYISDKEDKSLFPEADHGVSIVVVYKKPPMVNGPTLRKRIILPHPSIQASSAMFCLIMPDFDITTEALKDPDVEKQSREWEERIEADHKLTKKHIAKIMTKNQLMRECRTFADKKKLATAYDVFLVENRVHKAVRHHLGKEFIKAHKTPIDFDYTKDLSKIMQNAAATSIFDLSANKGRIAVNAGHLAQPHADLVENVEHTLNEMITHCPGGLRNIRSLCIQLSSSNPSLPIYTDDGSANEITMPKAPKKREQDKEIIDELSTLPEGLKVAVTKSGRVRVLRETDGVAVLYPTIKDEHTSRDRLKPRLDPVKIAKRKLAKATRTKLHKAAVAKAIKKQSGGEVYKAKASTKNRPLLKKTETKTKEKKRGTRKAKKLSTKAKLAAVI